MAQHAMDKKIFINNIKRLPMSSGRTLVVVHSKPFYQNLRQRVETTVKRSAQKLSPENNQLQISEKNVYRVGIKPCQSGSMIPLHAGSQVYVSKSDLMQIFIPNACIYTSRLSELVFGIDVLGKVASAKVKDKLLLLDHDLLKSLITHVVLVFSMRGEDITESTVQEYILHKIRTISSTMLSQLTIDNVHENHR